MLNQKFAKLMLELQVVLVKQLVTIIIGAGFFLRFLSGNMVNTLERDFKHGSSHLALHVYSITISA